MSGISIAKRKAKHSANVLTRIRIMGIIRRIRANDSLLLTGSVP